MKKIIVLFGVVVCSYSSSWNLKNHDGLTLGEISLDHHDLKAFSLGETGVPTIKTIPISVSYPIVQTVPQPYPVAVVIPKLIPYEVENHIIKPVEKKIPTPVEKIIPIRIEKPVPFHVVKHIPVPVEKPFPLKIPIYKTIFHKIKSH